MKFLDRISSFSAFKQAIINVRQEITFNVCKGKAVFVHTFKAYGDCGGVALFTRKICTRLSVQLYTPAAVSAELLWFNESLFTYV